MIDVSMTDMIDDNVAWHYRTVAVLIKLFGNDRRAVCDSRVFGSGISVGAR
jgi:hypothetical protein